MARWQYQQKAELPQARAGSWAEGIQADKWLPVYDVAARPRPFSLAAIVSGSFFQMKPDAVPQPIMPDKWLGVEPDPLARRKNQALATGLTETPRVAVVEQVTLDKWYVRGADIIPRPRQSALATGLTEPPEVATQQTVDKWQSKYEVSARPRGRAVYGFQFFAYPEDRSAEKISCDKWLPDFPDIVFRGPDMSLAELYYATDRLMWKEPVRFRYFELTAPIYAEAFEGEIVDSNMTGEILSED